MIRFIPRRLFSQAVLIICLILVANSIFYSLFVGGRNAKIALEQKKQHAQVVVENLSIYSAHRVIVGDYSGLESFLKQSAKLPDVREIAVIDNEGVFLSHIKHFHDGSPKAVYTSPAKIKDIESVESIKITKDNMVVVQPISAGKQLGVVRVVFSLDSIRALQNNILQDTLIIGCVSFGATILIILISLRVPIKAIQELSVFARKLNYAKGETISGKFLSLELERLAESLNVASKEIQVAKKELADEREFLDITLNSISDGVIATGTNLDVLLVNKTAKRMTGLEAGEAVGEYVFNLFTLLYRCEPVEIDCLAKSVVEYAKPFEYGKPLVLKSRDGDNTDIIFSAAPIISREKRTVGAVMVFRDISDKKRVEEEKELLFTQLQQAQKMEAIGTLAGGVAHDFNNILTPILGFSQLLQTSIGNKKPQADYISAIVKASSRAQSLVQQILAFSRLGEYELIPVQMDLILKETIKLLKSSIPSTIRFETDIEKQCCFVTGDPTKIHQIILNLCTNAYYAMKNEGGVLGIKLEKADIAISDVTTELNLEPGKYICLTVSDTGCGILDENKDKIFDPYFTTKLRGEGTGLGLSVVHGIVQLLKGHISFHSEPGKGTAFSVYLPRTSEKADLHQLVDSKQNEIIGGSERLLVVDDEDYVLDFETDALKSLGYEVHAFSSSKEALEAFERQPDYFDLIITDMTMPHLTGDQLAQKIITIRPSTPILLCTGFSEIIDEPKAKALGIRGYISKPIKFALFADMVRRSLDDT
jgi:PAS domain S-box-containing protein